VSKVDTSAEAVERLAREHDLVRFTLSMKSHQHDKTAATLRALLAERDAARKGLQDIADMNAGSPSWAAEDALAKSQEARHEHP
jgi:hypothetical protein